MYGFYNPIEEEPDFDPRQVTSKKQSRFDDEPLSAPMGGARESDVFIKPKSKLTSGGDVEPLGKKRNTIGIIPDTTPVANLVSYPVQNACTVLVQAIRSGEFQSLPTQVAQMLEKVASKPNEFFRIDPFVFMTYTLWTGSCNIYLKEAVPLSVLILLIYFDASFQVEILPDGETISRPKKFSEVSLFPYDGSTTSFAQGFQWKQSLETAFQNRGMNMKEKMEDVDYFMETLGEMSSDDAANMLFVQEQSKTIGAFLNNVKLSAQDSKIGASGDMVPE
jgi:hypothetical protein